MEPVSARSQEPIFRIGRNLNSRTSMSQDQENHEPGTKTKSAARSRHDQEKQAPGPKTKREKPRGPEAKNQKPEGGQAGGGEQEPGRKIQNRKPNQQERGPGARGQEPTVAKNRKKTKGDLQK